MTATEYIEKEQDGTLTREEREIFHAHHLEFDRRLAQHMNELDRLCFPELYQHRDQLLLSRFREIGWTW